MAKNEVYKRGDFLPLPVPADTASGAPVGIGGFVGVTQTAEGEGGHDEGYANVALCGVWDVSVTGAVASVGLPVYITSANALTTTRVANKLFGHAMETKAAGAGIIAVRVVGHNSGIAEA